MGRSISKTSRRHYLDDFVVIESGALLEVGGLPRACNRTARWHSAQTPGGRFCTVFDFDDDLIRRMDVYLEPDFARQGRVRDGCRMPIVSLPF